jgi:hypothetical protein
VTDGPLLTLEPLIDALREGVEASGWELSGLQKTTSHQFGGRWEGESTRSAYLFFHRPGGPEWASVDVYLDETGQGLTGNLALVADLHPFGQLGPTGPLIEALSAVSRRHLPPRVRRPLTVRFRLPDVDEQAEVAETEVRFKARIPRPVIEQGHGSVDTFAREIIAGFDQVLRAEGVRRRGLDGPGEG